MVKLNIYKTCIIGFMLVAYASCKKKKYTPEQIERYAYIVVDNHILSELRNNVKYGANDSIYSIVKDSFYAIHGLSESTHKDIMNKIQSDAVLAEKVDTRVRELYTELTTR